MFLSKLRQCSLVLFFATERLPVASILRFEAFVREHSCLVNLGSTCNVWFMKLSGHFDVSTQPVLSTEANVTYAEQLYSGLACYAGTQQYECDVA